MKEFSNPIAKEVWQMIRASRKEAAEFRKKQAIEEEVRRKKRAAEEEVRRKKRAAEEEARRKKLAAEEEARRKKRAAEEEKFQQEMAEIQRKIEEQRLQHKAAEEARHQKQEAQKEEDRKQRIIEQRAYKKRIQKIEDMFSSQWGRFVESLVEGDLVKLLKAKNIEVNHTNSRLKGQYEGDHWEIDIVAVNSTEVVVVEVKSSLKVRDVNDFLESLKMFNKWTSSYRDKRLYGAIAYLKADEHSPVYAERKGLFVIKATGSSASIINKENFKPKAFYSK